jgi:hypothetical protein
LIGHEVFTKRVYYNDYAILILGVESTKCRKSVGASVVPKELGLIVFFIRVPAFRDICFFVNHGGFLQNGSNQRF